MIQVSPGQTVEQRASDVVVYELPLDVWDNDFAKVQTTAEYAVIVMRGAEPIDVQAHGLQANRRSALLTVSGGHAGGKYEIARTARTKGPTPEQRTKVFRVRVIG